MTGNVGKQRYGQRGEDRQEQGFGDAGARRGGPEEQEDYPSPQRFDEEPPKPAKREPPPVIEMAMPGKAPGGGLPRTPEQEYRPVVDDEPRPRGKPAPPVDDGWGGKGLGDAFAPKKAAPKAPQGGGGGGGGKSSSGSKDCSKTTREIMEWINTLPESHVPKTTQEKLVDIVGDKGHTGATFSDYVMSVPPEVCAPKHAMKLKAAWKNVLQEDAMREVAKANLESNATKQKATMLVC